jgi:protein TonB
MSSSSASAGAPSRSYVLSDDLAKLCLPQEFKESHSTLAYVNSICALFLAIGLVGLKQPRVHVRPINQPTEIIPVVFTPPEDQKPPTEEENKPDEPDTTQDQAVDMPQVLTVVAPADAKVAFAVPVQGAVAVAAQAHLAAPPPAVLKQSSGPQTMKFDPRTATEGVFPEPDYPRQALQNRQQGTVTVRITVDESGAVTSVKVQKTSGFSFLDDSALRVVKNRWRFPPAPQPRDLIWDCTFRLNQ